MTTMRVGRPLARAVRMKLLCSTSIRLPRITRRDGGHVDEGQQRDRHHHEAQAEVVPAAGRQPVQPDREDQHQHRPDHEGGKHAAEVADQHHAVVGDAVLAQRGGDAQAARR